MRATIHCDGNQEPRQSVTLILTEFSKTDSVVVVQRTFFCADCCEVFEAGVDGDTIHDCNEGTWSFRFDSVPAVSESLIDGIN